MSQNTLQPIRVMKLNRTWREIEAEIYSAYAVHYMLYEPQLPRDTFAVTHIESGMMVAFTEVLDNAREFAQEMNAHNVADQVKAAQRQESGGLLKKPWFVKLLKKYRMSIYITRGKKDDTGKNRTPIHYGD